MAKYQYRLSGAFAWVSSPGNAMLALQNKAGSGKRITVRSLEIEPLGGRDYRGSGDVLVMGQMVMSAFGSQSDGDDVACTPADTNAAWPSGLSVVTGGGFSATRVTTRAAYVQHAEMVTGSTLMMKYQLGLQQSINATMLRRAFGASEQPLVRNGEAWSIYLGDVRRTCPLEVSLTFVVLGSPNRTWTARQVVGIGGVGTSLLTIVNGSASNVRVVEFNIRMLGARNVTPYLQVVPFSAADPSAIESNSVTSFLKMDTASPDANAWVAAVYDTPLVPSGAPIQYASDVGAGAPKGANYLVTKDFLGPVLRSFFPECLTMLAQPASSLPPDNLGMLGHKSKDLLARRAGFTIRPGEGVAVVAAAETFGNTAAAIGGWASLLIGINFDVENEIQPYLNLTGLQAGSDIVVLEAGTGNFLQQIDAYSGTSWSWAYDSDIVTSVDVAIYKPGFVPLALRNVTTPAQGLSIPIVQTPDRNYS